MPFSSQDREIDAIIAEAEAVQWSLQEVPEPLHLDLRSVTSFPLDGRLLMSPPCWSALHRLLSQKRSADREVGKWFPRIFRVWVSFPFYRVSLTVAS